MGALNYSSQVLDEIFQDEQRECWEAQQVDEARARYESAVVEEARAIVEGRSRKPVTEEHLRVVLEWLDGTRFQLKREQPGAECVGETPPF